MIELADVETRQRTARDPLFALERAQQDKRRAKRKRQGMEALLEVQARGRDDYTLNQLARTRFRRSDDNPAQCSGAGCSRGVEGDDDDNSGDGAQLDAARHSFSKRDAARARSAHSAKSRLMVVQGAFGATSESNAADTAFTRGIRPAHLKIKMPRPSATAATAGMRNNSMNVSEASSGSISIGAGMPTFSIRKKRKQPTKQT